MSADRTDRARSKIEALLKKLMGSGANEHERDETRKAIERLTGKHWNAFLDELLAGQGSSSASDDSDKALAENVRLRVEIGCLKWDLDRAREREAKAQSDLHFAEKSAEAVELRAKHAEKRAEEAERKLLQAYRDHIVTVEALRHQAARRRLELTCEVCGSQFQAMTRKARTCSGACRTELYRRNQANSQQPVTVRDGCSAITPNSSPTVTVRDDRLAN
jgi:hypothetical protein